MTKKSHHNFISLGILLSIVSILLSVQSQWSDTVQAANSSADPLVIIARDATNSSCIEVFRANIDTVYETIQRIPCPMGTIISSVLVNRSIAIALHEPYVNFSSSSISSIAYRNQLSRQIQQLMQAKGQLLRKAAKRSKVYPLTSCGQEGSMSVTWRPNDSIYENGSLTSTEQFYRHPNPNCNTVNLEIASIRVNVVTLCPFSWNYDLYAGGQFNVPGKPMLSSQGHTYSHGVYQDWPKGYYYETWIQLQLSNKNYCNNDFSYYYVNIGPIQ